ncbi:MAG: DUF6067 family protein, partial [Bacteroidales bacterium]|nr:DUF6067 family protein [Bacteroidales bacterium]
MGAHIFIRRVYLPSAILLLLLFISGCGRSKKEILYTTGDWFTDTLGYHRIEIQVNSNANAVYLNVEWRRRDSNPEKKLVIITDGTHGNVVDNIYPLEVNNERGEFVFQPVSGRGTYFLYYLPGRLEGRSNYPVVNYPEAKYKTDNAWISLHKLTDTVKIKSLPEAEVVSFQSSDQFNSFYPMEIIATREEVLNMLSSYPQHSYLLFPESRFNSIRMKKYLPQKWIGNGPAGNVTGEAMRGEYFTFQIGLFNTGDVIEDIAVTFSNITDKKGNVIIEADKISSFNTSGRGWNGKLFKKHVKANLFEIQPLWCGMMIPENIGNSTLRGSVTIKPDSRESQTIPIDLKIIKEVIEDHGDNEPWRMTRLRWLDSDLGFDYSVVSPFINVERRNNILGILGREITIGNSGLPVSYRTYFNENNTRVNQQSSEILAAPFSFNVFGAGGNRLYFSNDEIKYDETGPGAYKWKVNSENRLLSRSTTGIIESDGFASIRIAITAKESTDLTNFQLTIPVRKEFAKYFMGLGYKGGNRPYSVRWKWDRMKHQEGAWIGNINGGLQFPLRDDSYERPLNTNFYREKPLVMPVGWYNEGKGGIRLNSLENSVIIECYSGHIHLEKGEEIVFTLNLLLTPFKIINTDKQWSTRFYHRYENLDSILAYGANTVNVHHATRINPWINYPFLEQDKMKAYIDSAHSLGMKVKIYNTIRELSNRAPEIFAIKSLGDEIFSPGNGNGFNWLQEHLGDDYIAAWFVPTLKDAAIINSGMSRWHNYYIEGMQWLTQKMEIDGLYLD